VKKFKATFGGILSDGQGEMKGQIFRIAHIGYFDYMDTIAMVGALEHVLAELTPGKFELGAGLAAAQRVYAEHAALRTSATGA
jgi:aspartate aminotransferase-like enzyme